MRCADHCHGLGFVSGDLRDEVAGFKDGVEV